MTDSRAGVGKITMNQEHLVVPKGKEMFKKKINKRWQPIKKNIGANLKELLTAKAGTI